MLELIKKTIKIYYRSKINIHIFYSIIIKIWALTNKCLSLQLQ